MAENDLNTNQAVTDSSLTDQPATDQDLSQSVTGTADADVQQTLADGTTVDKSVPYDKFKAANDAKNAAEQQTQLLQGQMQIMQANQQPVQQVAQQQPQTTLEQAMADCGVTGDEMYGEMTVKVLNRKAEIDTALASHTNAAHANQQFENTHTDFGSVVGIRNPMTGSVQPSAEIMNILTEKPWLTAAAYSSSEGAYKIVMSEREITKLEQQNTVQQEHLQQQGIDTKLAPVSGAAASGGALSAKATGPVTIAQQEDMEQRVASGEFNTKG